MIRGKIAVGHVADGNQPGHVGVAEFIIVVAANENQPDQRNQTDQTANRE